MVSPSRRSALHWVGISLSAVSESWVGKNSSCVDGVIRFYVTVYYAQCTWSEQMRIDLAIAVGISYKSNSLRVHHIFFKYAFVRNDLKLDSRSWWVDVFWMGSFRWTDVVPWQGRRFLPFHICLPRRLWRSDGYSLGEMKIGSILSFHLLPSSSLHLLLSILLPLYPHSIPFLPITIPSLPFQLLSAMTRINVPLFLPTLFSSSPSPHRPFVSFSLRITLHFRLQRYCPSSLPNL